MENLQKKPYFENNKQKLLPPTLFILLHKPRLNFFVRGKKGYKSLIPFSSDNFVIDQDDHRLGTFRKMCRFYLLI
jgi:hypothetical protein